jgi:bifunctional DNA-binding transcriptional regulator/antitoxin component of YhaV-PrlF toxin-antitoxin module
MASRKLKPREQGDIGELSAMEWLASKGAYIYIPVGHSPDVDMVAGFGGRLVRVEVKTSNHRNEIGRWQVHISTRGGNQSWTGLVKYFDPKRCDFLFVHVGDGRRWFIPSGELSCRAGLTLGGTKYSEFEIESGRPFGEDPPVPSKLASVSEAEGGRRSRRAGPDCKSGALVAEWVRFPPPPLPSSQAGPSSPHPIARTRLSANHQLTIPRGPYEAAQLEVGDRFRVEAESEGRVVLIRIEEYMGRHAEQLAISNTDEHSGEAEE